MIAHQCHLPHRPAVARFALIAGVVAAVTAVQAARPVGSRATSVPAGSYSVSGTLSNGAGMAIPYMPIGLYATDVVLDGAGPDYTLPQLGTATTDAAGRWSMAVPSPLPKDVQAMADANGGIVNVSAISMATAPDGTPMTAMQNFGLTNPNATQPTSLQQIVEQEDAQPISATFYPVKANAGTAYDDGGTIDASDNKAYLSDSGADYTSGGEGSNGSPTVTQLETLNGTNYASVMPSPARSSCGTAPVAHRAKTVSHLETPVSETHGYWDAVGEVRLGSSASQSLGVGISADNSIWQLQGTTRLGHSWGYTIGHKEAGPQNAHQIDIPVDWAKFHYYYHLCEGAGGTYVDIDWVWRSLGFDPGPTQNAISPGRSVASGDGSDAYAKSNSNYRMNFGANDFFGLQQGTSLTYSFTAGIFPLSLTAETAYDSTREQRVTFGDKTHRSHYIWGAHHRPDEGVLVFYSW